MRILTLLGRTLCVILVALTIAPPTAGRSPNADGLVASQPQATPSDPAPWFIETVDEPDNVGQYASVAIDPQTGVTYISYYDADHGYLRMATYVGSGGNCGANQSWSCEIVDKSADVGRHSSIAVAAGGRPIIAYRDATNASLKLAFQRPIGWTIKTVHDPEIGNMGQYCSLALTSAGQVRIAYYSSNMRGDDSLWYAQFVGSGNGNCTDPDYDCDLIHSGDRVGKYASLGLDSSDRPHIAYYDEGSDALRYAFHTGSSWILREILPIQSGQYASLYVSKDTDRPHIAHYDGVNHDLEYAVYVGSGGNCGFNSSATQFEWQCDPIDSMGEADAPRGVAIAADKFGAPFIAYQTGGIGINTARPVSAVGLAIGNCGPENLFNTWQCDRISLSFRAGQGDYMSLAVNPGGQGTIAYYGKATETDGNLMVAYQQHRVYLAATLND